LEEVEEESTGSYIGNFVKLGLNVQATKNTIFSDFSIEREKEADFY